MPAMQQNPDGSWSEAVPLGWQGSGIDWEVYRVDRTSRRTLLRMLGSDTVDRMPDGSYYAEGYDEDVLVATITARWRWTLGLKIARWHRRHKAMPPNRG